MDAPPPGGPPPAPGGPPPPPFSGPAPRPKAGSARTGPLPLHPMTLSDILDGAFKLYRANAMAVLTVAAAFIVPLQFVAALIGRLVIAGPATDFFNDLFEEADVAVEGDLVAGVTEAVSGLAVIAALPFVAGGVSLIVARSYLGQQVDAAAALAVVRRRWWPLLASWVLVHALAVFGLLLCLLPGMLLLALYIAVPAAVVVEDRGPLAAMGRSWRLARTRVWTVLGIGLLAWVLDAAISSALGWILDLASFFVPGGWVVRVAGSMAINVVTTPFVAIVAVLIYFDLRIRNEGFDLQVMAADMTRRPDS